MDGHISMGSNKSLYNSDWKAATQKSEDMEPRGITVYEMKQNERGLNKTLCNGYKIIYLICTNTWKYWKNKEGQND
jgi:hypothetical protein